MDISGEKLKIARIFRNMSVSELAHETDVTRQAIYQYEKNRITPKSEVLFQIISVLDFPLAFFTESKNNKKAVTENTFFRALSSAKVLDLETQKIKTEFIFDIYNFLSRYLDFPKLDLPTIDYNEQSPEEIADNLREYWRLESNPITNMVSLLEKKGIIVSSIKTDVHEIDAFTQIRSEEETKQFCVVLGDDKQSMVRRNFDAAHELGHIIMHKDFSNVKELEKNEFRSIEDEANRFAAAFLLPRDEFFMDLNEPTNLNSYIELKRKWKVSIAAMIMRAREIERISPTQYTNLMKKISYKKWRKKEPLDDVWKVNKPRLFRKAINILIENEVLSPSQVVKEFAKFGYPMCSSDIEELLGLEVGTLEENSKQSDPSLVLSIKDYNQ